MICVDCGGDFDPAETIDCKHYRALCVQRLRAALSERDARVAKLEGALRRIDLQCDHYAPKTPAPYRAPLELIGNRARVALNDIPPVADAGATTALCRYCGQSESNHHDGVGAARDCTFTPIEPYTPPTLSAETMQRGEEIMQRLVDRTAPAVDEQAAVKYFVDAWSRWALNSYVCTDEQTRACLRTLRTAFGLDDVDGSESWDVSRLYEKMRDRRDVLDVANALRTRRASGEGQR